MNVIEDQFESFTHHRHQLFHALLVCDSVATDKSAHQLSHALLICDSVATDKSAHQLSHALLVCDSVATDKFAHPSHRRTTLSADQSI